jgi:transcription-repair coupling factor (superfamily II helicase)
MARDDSNQRSRHAALGPTVARLCEAVAQEDVIAVASGEGRGEAIARAVAALSPALVLWCPPPDTLPGEGAPASPAIAGRRVAALAALRDRGNQRVLLITEATAATQAVAPPQAFALPPIRLQVGQDVDGEALASELEAIGYFSDDRVDEPGEFSIRAGTADIFPADAERPIRVHFDEGSIESVSTYDPVSQLGLGDNLNEVALLPATEPQAGADAVSLFDHLPGSAVALDPEAMERRDRFLELADESIGKRSAAALVRDWDKAVAGRNRVDLGQNGEIAGSRFVEARSPERAFFKAFNAARSEGKRVLIAGTARDIRFAARRLERRTGEVPTQVADWADVRAAEPGAILIATAELGRGWTEDGLSSSPPRTSSVSGRLTARGTPALTRSARR